MKAKTIKIIYWILTGLVIIFMGVGAFFDAIAVPEAVAYVTKLGYPAYIVPFLGVAKLLGILAILIPGLPKVKEWAYAGLTFDLIGALYSHIMMGYSVGGWAPLLVGLFLIVGSYIFYHKKALLLNTNEV